MLPLPFLDIYGYISRRGFLAATFNIRSTDISYIPISTETGQVDS